MNEWPFFDFAKQNQKMATHSKYFLAASAAKSLLIQQPREDF
jgi:hypothetical protein